MPHLRLSDAAHLPESFQPDFLRYKQAAHYCGVSQRQLRYWVDQKLISPPYRVGSNILLFERRKLYSEVARLIGHIEETTNPWHEGRENP